MLWQAGIGVSQMQHKRVQSPGLEDLLEKEMATHSSNLAWEISWTEDPGRLEFIESERNQTQLSH